MDALPQFAISLCRILPDYTRKRTPELETAITAASFVPLCDRCLQPHNLGLCERHARDILPQLARASWLRLIGIFLTEQTKLQTAAPVYSAHERYAINKAQRHAAKRAARAQRRQSFLAQIAA